MNRYEFNLMVSEISALLHNKYHAQGFILLWKDKHGDEHYCGTAKPSFVLDCVDYLRKAVKEHAH